MLNRNNRNRELVKAIKEDYLFDYIVSSWHKFHLPELVEILKELSHSTRCLIDNEIKQKKFSNVLLDNLLEYTCILDNEDYDDWTEDEKAYKRYELGIDTYEDYLTICEFEECEPLPPIEED